MHNQIKPAGTICKTNQKTVELFAKSNKIPKNYMKTYKEASMIVTRFWPKVDIVLAIVRQECT